MSTKKERSECPLPGIIGKNFLKPAEEEEGTLAKGKRTSKYKRKNQSTELEDGQNSSDTNRAEAPCWKSLLTIENQRKGRSFFIPSIPRISACALEHRLGKGRVY